MELNHNKITRLIVHVHQIQNKNRTNYTSSVSDEKIIPQTVLNAPVNMFPYTILRELTLNI